MPVLKKVSLYYSCLLLIVSPLKLTIGASSREVANFPLSTWEFLFSAWPNSMYPVLMGLSLLLALIAYNPNVTELVKRHFLILCPLSLAALISGFSLAYSSELEIGLSFVWHLLGCLAFSLTIIIHLQYETFSKRGFVTSLSLGCAFLLFYCIYQLHWGFDEFRNYIKIQEEIYKVEIPANLKHRIMQNRIYGFFTIPNSLGAYLILLIPLVLALCWEYGKKIEPPRASSITLTILAALPLFYCLYHTKSRGAFVGLVLGIIITAVLFCISERKKLKKQFKFIIPAFLALIIVSVIGFKLISDGRNMGSLEARFVYWDAAWQMFTDEPLTGVGMGDYFPLHMKLKPEGAEEARLAHSVFFHFISQCGILGGLAAILIIMLPVLFVINKIKQRYTIDSPIIFWASICGCSSWVVQGMMDFSIQISACLMLFFVLPLLAIKPLELPEKKRDTKGLILAAVLVLLTLTSIWRWPGDYYYQVLDNELSSGKIPKTDLMNKSLDTLPFAPYPAIRTARAAIKQQQFDYAIELLQIAEKRAPLQGSIKYHLARAHLAKMDYTSARESVKKAIECYPGKTKYSDLLKVIDDAEK
ncbi:MAG: O-antigen ligase family protein [Lentisphaeria bacterium]|nr:O-antigen ligase family protein [Lentisphaeria bacterium]NQZ70680.1 O-antigen ligase family protein [Lentisphaeria bacterium]